jgi:hypothetical protein
MIIERINMEHEYYSDMILRNGFKIENEDTYSPVDPQALVNSSKFTDCEFRCDCGAFIGQDIIGQKCPICGSEIMLHSLNFNYTGWVNLNKHKVITPSYYFLIKRCIGNNMMNFILGNYKADHDVKYSETDTEFDSRQNQKKRGRVATNDINAIIKKIPKNKHKYMGIGFDAFAADFENIMIDCCPKPKQEDLKILLEHKNDVFTSHIPIYSTAFRPVNTTSESQFYPTINRWLTKIVALQFQLRYMQLDVEVISALNCIQNNWIEACNHLIDNEMGKKTGFIRSEIVGGPYHFSARGVITLDPLLNINEIAVPYNMLLGAYKYKVAHTLSVRYGWTLEESCRFIDENERDQRIVKILDEIVDTGVWCLMLREPTNNLASIALVKVKRYKFEDADDTVSLTIEPLGGMNADFDGDQLDYVFLDQFGYECFKPFMYSCMTNYVTGEFQLSLREWFAICAGRMSE